ncbi:transcriptional regulator [Stenotrophomonas sp. SPM]|uniref:helix-turn-helix domain-containing protein n=1 Tax=unclassified Stenotrophomonas TaxID=196198 RepID=UPI000DE646C0|nr:MULTISPECIES: DNA-binding transcriptional regulator [unclassified Stenotrophomonas]PWB28988.1 transcriptional regulator [Stenotrophomonas sp. SPM]
MAKALERRRARSALPEAVHDAAVSLHTHGFIDKRRLSSYEALCLEPVPDYSSAQIRALRTSLRLSQPVFAGVLNTSVSTVRSWEQGEKKPSGPSLKLLNLIDRKGLEAVL